MDLKQLSKLIALCRKKGIKSFKQGDIEFTLSDVAEPRRRKSSKEDSKEIETEGQLTEEDTLFWSSAGISESYGVGN